MEFKKIQFVNSEAQKSYENYLNQVQNTIKKLSKEDRKDILMEINSHIYESNVANIGRADEVMNLQNTLSKIGNPREVLKPLVAEKKLKQAVRTLNPIHIFQALIFNLSFGFIYSLFFILYLFLGSFVLLIFAKIFFSDHVGFYYQKGKIFQYGGFIQNENLQQYEVLGNWFIPVTIILALIFYCIISLLLRLKNVIRAKNNFVLITK